MRIEWLLDDPRAVAGRAAEVRGDPVPAVLDGIPCLRFDGREAGLVVDCNPIRGAAAFRVEVLFRPERGGGAEQRFLHIQEDGSPNRALLETRISDDGRWYGDVFLKSGSGERFLNRASLLHEPDVWHTLELRYADGRISQWVDGKKELEGALRFSPLGEGSLSLGMRRDGCSPFKGAIGRVRFMVL